MSGIFKWTISNVFLGENLYTLSKITSNIKYIIESFSQKELGRLCFSKLVADLLMQFKVILLQPIAKKRTKRYSKRLE